MTRKHVLLLVFAPLLAVGITSHALGAPPQIDVSTNSYFSSVVGIPVWVQSEIRIIARDGGNYNVKTYETYTNLETGQTVEIRGSYSVTIFSDGNMTLSKRRGNLQFFVPGDVVPVSSGYFEIRETWDSYYEKIVGLHLGGIDVNQELFRLLSL